MLFNSLTWKGAEFKNDVNYVNGLKPFIYLPLGYDKFIYDKGIFICRLLDFRTSLYVV